MTRFRCACCGFSLPRSCESHEKRRHCFCCEPLTDDERLVMEREYSAHRMRAREVPVAR